MDFNGPAVFSIVWSVKINFIYNYPLAYILILLLPGASIYAQSGEVRRPNILFCISDDQSWVHTSFAGEKAISTSAFDRIAREGIYFRMRFFCLLHPDHFKYQEASEKSKHINTMEKAGFNQYWMNKKCGEFI